MGLRNGNGCVNVGKGVWLSALALSYVAQDDCRSVASVATASTTAPPSCAISTNEDCASFRKKSTKDASNNVFYSSDDDSVISSNRARTKVATTTQISTASATAGRLTSDDESAPSPAQSKIKSHNSIFQSTIKHLNPLPVNQTPLLEPSNQFLTSDYHYLLFHGFYTTYISHNDMNNTKARLSLLLHNPGLKCRFCRKEKNILQEEPNGGSHRSPHGKARVNRM
jgi:hypothetical protein